MGHRYKKEGTEEKVAPLSPAAPEHVWAGPSAAMPRPRVSGRLRHHYLPSPCSPWAVSLDVKSQDREGGGGEHTSPREKVAKMQSKAGKASVNNTAKTLPLVFQETHNKMTFSRETYIHKQKHRAI